MKTKTKSRLCTGVVTFALGAALMGGSVFAATETKTAQSGNSDSMVTGTISLGDKGVPKKDKYLYSYCATLRGDSSDAAQGAKVTISGAVSKSLPLSKTKKTYAVQTGYSSTNWISVTATQSGFNSERQEIIK